MTVLVRLFNWTDRTAEPQTPRVHDVPACTWVEEKSSDFQADELLVRTPGAGDLEGLPDP